MLYAPPSNSQGANTSIQHVKKYLSHLLAVNRKCTHNVFKIRSVLPVCRNENTGVIKLRNDPFLAITWTDSTIVNLRIWVGYSQLRHSERGACWVHFKRKRSGPSGHR